MKGKLYEEIRAAQEEAEPLALHYGRLIASGQLEAGTMLPTRGELADLHGCRVSVAREIHRLLERAHLTHTAPGPDGAPRCFVGSR
ncbi:hypothetical protein ACFWIB_11730 [Streptomyces sp. NPDC127051]|uniref:hypothetical protein n=1 Tax=Streptomyces sp. NPDC127051 TaxID=3347119 RepID=UPI0036652E1D